MPQPGSHRHNVYRPRARPRRRHVAPVDWMCRWRRSCHRSRAAVTTCVQIGHKGRFAFFRPATEPRNHAVSFRLFQSGKALCIQFGHRVRCRGRFGHRAPPHPDAQPRPNRSQTPNVSLMGGGSARRPRPALHGRGHSARPGAVRTGRGHSTPSGTGIRSPDARDAPGWKEKSPAAQDVPVGGRARAPRARRATRTPVGPGAKGTTSRPPAGLGC